MKLNFEHNISANNAASERASAGLELEAIQGLNNELLELFDTIVFQIKSKELELKALESNTLARASLSKIRQGTDVSKMMLDLLREQLIVAATDEEKKQIQNKIFELDPMEGMSSRLAALREELRSLRTEMDVHVSALAKKYNVNRDFVQKQVDLFFK